MIAQSQTTFGADSTIVRISASRFMCATISTSLVAASATIATMRPSRSNLGASVVPVSIVSPSVRSANAGDVMIGLALELAAD